MFSSKELISFVFVNENDTYYGDDLIKRDLNQYLWERLHGSYEAVYFLSANDSSFRVTSYGDVCCNEYVPGKKKLRDMFSSSSEQNRLGNWILRQLQAKPGEAAAIVCPLEDFCSVLSDSRWDAVLEQIAGETKRTGVFVLTASATAERTTSLLLDSPVFEKLRETAVTDLRGGALREVYGTLKKRKWDSCLFLNTFTWERVRSLLLHLVMEYPERCGSCGQLDQLTDYLHAYLRDPDAVGDEPLLSEELPAEYLMYTTLYEALRNERTWKRLEDRSAQYAASGRNWERRESSGAYVPVLRDRKTYAGRCMKLRLPQWVRRDEETGEAAAELLRGIRGAVSAPKNRPENSKIVASAESMLDQIDSVRIGDVETYIQVLNGLKFCIQQVYTAQEDEKTDRILEIFQKQLSAITISDQCFGLRRDLNLYQKQEHMGSLATFQLEQMQKQLDSLEQMRERYMDLVNASILELTLPQRSSNIMDRLAELEEEVQKCEAELSKEKNSFLKKEPGSAPETLITETTPQKEKEEVFELRPEDFNFLPPQV